MSKPFVEGLASFTRLTVLDLWEVSFDQSPIEGVSPPSFKLQKFTANKVTLPAEQLTWLLWSSTKSLQDLELLEVEPPLTEASTAQAQKAAFIDAMLSLLLNVAPHIHHLTMSEPIEGLLQDERTVDVFKRLEYLQRLTINATDVNPAAWVALPTAILRHHLRVLNLSFIPSLEPALIINTVGKLAPALKRVSITTRVDQSALFGPEDRWLWSRAERRALRAQCNLHGIVLEVDGLFEPDELELSEDETDPLPAIAGSDDDAAQDVDDMDELFVFDDERRERYEEELRNDYALLEEARHKGDDPSEDEFLDAASSEPEDL